MNRAFAPELNGTGPPPAPSSRERCRRRPCACNVSTGGGTSCGAAAGEGVRGASCTAAACDRKHSVGSAQVRLAWPLGRQPSTRQEVTLRASGACPRRRAAQHVHQQRPLVPPGLGWAWNTGGGGGGGGNTWCQGQTASECMRVRLSNRIVSLLDDVLSRVSRQTAVPPEGMQHQHGARVARDASGGGHRGAALPGQVRSEECQRQPRAKLMFLHGSVGTMAEQVPGILHALPRGVARRAAQRWARDGHSARCCRTRVTLYALVQLIGVVPSEALSTWPAACPGCSAWSPGSRRWRPRTW